MNLDRRRVLGAVAGLAAGAAITGERLRPKYRVNRKPAQSRVAILAASDYSNGLEDLIMRGLRLFGVEVRGKSVLLKPNLVEVLPGPVNTDPVLVAAAAECFLRMGAATVVVGDGPGHQRDTEAVLIDSGLEEQLRTVKVPFIDLNRDEVVRTSTLADFSGLGELWLPRTVLQSDIVVSMPKVKTHHWAGVTLAMKNMFGVAPGVRYGWPKNPLHWHGITESVLDICATVPVRFVIADGIIAMGGNGPLQGQSRELHRLVLADDPVAADATCARLMGFDPMRIRHIAIADQFLGNMQRERIVQLGEPLVRPDRPFAVLPDFAYLLDSTPQ